MTGITVFLCRLLAHLLTLVTRFGCGLNSISSGGKGACRNADLLKSSGPFSNPSGLSVFSGGPQGGDAKAKTGEKDWIHANSVAYDPVRDQVMVSFNVPSELIVVSSRLEVRHIDDYSVHQFG